MDSTPVTMMPNFLREYNQVVCGLKAKENAMSCNNRKVALFVLHFLQVIGIKRCRAEFHGERIGRYIFDTKQP